jgi:hypothetical protein
MLGLMLDASLYKIAHRNLLEFLIVLRGAARHIGTHGQAGLSLPRPVAAIKRRRTEISASLKAWQPGAVGRHTKTLKI